MLVEKIDAYHQARADKQEAELRMKEASRALKIALIESGETDLLQINWREMLKRYRR
jgi:hypothetical protein